MIDTATVEEYMRSANPIPHIDDVDPDEFAIFVAAAETRRAGPMQAPSQDESRTTPLIRPRRRLRSAWAFAAAFILVAVSIGVAALLMQEVAAPVADESPPATTVDSAPVTTVGESVAPLSLTWTRAHQDPDVFRDAWVLDMTTGGPGVVAVGETHQFNETRAMVWTSTSGSIWTRIPHDEALFGRDAPASRMIGVTAAGPGLVAVGSLDGAFAVWTSTNGYNWTLVYTDAEAEMHDGSEAWGVVAGGAGLVAYGPAYGPAGDRPAVWASPDGITWTRIPNDTESFGPTTIHDMTAGGPGFVAVGVDETGFPSTITPAVWTSPDGYTWTRVPNSDAFSGPSVHMGTNSVTAGGPGLVAVGLEETADDMRAAVWTSPDGFTWTRVPHDDAVFSGPEGVGRMSSVAVNDSGLVAVGSGFQAVVWTSRDGITWTLEDIGTLTDTQSLSHVVATNSAFVANGFENHPDTAICIGTTQGAS